MRIAIVNDIALAVEAVRQVVLQTQEHQLAWVARDGAQAVQLCARDIPDLILMDLIMPRMDGVEATRRIMTDTPCPIVVVTASVDENSSKVFEAMGAGALDAVNTPALESPGARKSAHALLSKIETIRKLVGADVSRKRGAAAVPSLGQRASRHAGLVALGASAGGPAALAQILAALPADLPAAVVIVQHVDTQFAQGLANWLDYHTALQVRLAQDGDRPEPGQVLLAGRNLHLVFTGPTRLAYTNHPADCSYRPSVDVFFHSVERFWPGEVIGVLLTGMGRDGADGLRSLRRRGHHTIAQDQASSAVFGMPKAAAELDAAAEILALGRIGPRLKQLLTHKRKMHG
jgi:two-component system response regulator WspF